MKDKKTNDFIVFLYIVIAACFMAFPGLMMIINHGGY